MGALRTSFLVFFLLGSGTAARKTHVIILGKWLSIKVLSAEGEGQGSAEARIRPLLVDGQIKEYAAGPAHEVTDRLFVVRRVYRVNDTLPSDSGKAPHTL